MDILLIVIWILIFVTWFLYLKVKQVYDELESYGIPYEGAVKSYIGLIKVVTMREHFSYIMDRQYKKFKGQQIIPTFSLSTRGFVIRDPKIVKQITIKDFDSFINRDSNLNPDMDKIIGRIIFTLQDDEWRNMRHTLSPIFTSSKMKMMFGILSNCANDFITHYEEKAKNSEKLIIDCKESYMRLTVDGICSAVLGIEGDCVKNEDSELLKFSKSLQKFSLSMTLKFFLFMCARKIYIFLKLQSTKKEVYDFFYNAIVKVMKEREQKGIFRPDVIQLLMQAKKGQLEMQDKENEVNEAELSNFSANIEYDVKPKSKKLTHWTDEHYMAQGFIFFIAGLETTNILLQVTTFYLAWDSKIQQKLIKEVEEAVATLENAPVSYEVLHKMKYLDMVICEALRIWPPAEHVTRECGRDYLLKLDNGKSIKLRKKDMLAIPIRAIQHDEQYFENPEKFDPERFSDERKRSIVDGSYIPFGSGPRVCIGSRFALMEAKLLLFNILRKFTFEICDKTPEKFKLKPNIQHFDLKLRIFISYI